MERPLKVGVFATYRPHAKARVAFWDDARFLLILTGVRGAKTHTAARRMIRLIIRDLKAHQAAATPYSPGAVKEGTAMWWKRRPRLHYWVVAATFDLLKEARRCLLDSIPPEMLEHADAAENSLWLHPDILIEFKSGSHPERLVAVGLNGVWIDEGARLSPIAWPAYLSSRVADKRGWMQCTTTPLGRDWTWDHMEIHANAGEPDYAVHKWHTIDNTKMPHLVEQVEQARRLMPPQWFKREYEADRDSFIGQIYESFNEKTMVVDALPPGIRFTQIVGCQDWGFTAPGAHIIIGITSQDHHAAHIWALDEIYSPSQLVEDWWVPKIKLKQKLGGYGNYEVVGDPAEPDNIQRLRDAGIDCVRHRNNFSGNRYDEHARTIRSGIRFFASLIHQGRFHIVRRPKGVPTDDVKGKGCLNLIEEIKSYHWEQRKGGDMGGTLVERPAPNQKEHAATAARYGVTYALHGAVFVPVSMKAA